MPRKIAWTMDFGAAVWYNQAKTRGNTRMDEAAIYDRRSIRRFKQTELTQALLRQIFDAGRVAPSAKNRQPWKYIVMTGACKARFCDCMEAGIRREETQSALLPRSRFGLPDAKNTLRIMRQAPVVAAVVNPNGLDPAAALDADARFGEICDSLSVGASVENILLQAQRLGVGTLWIANTCFAYRELTAFLGEGGQLTGAIALGYADEAPAARARKAFAETVTFRSE
jgi:nitroreductase